MRRCFIYFSLFFFSFRVEKEQDCGVDDWVPLGRVIFSGDDNFNVDRLKVVSGPWDKDRPALTDLHKL